MLARLICCTLSPSWGSIGAQTGSRANERAQTFAETGSCHGRSGYRKHRGKATICGAVRCFGKNGVDCARSCRRLASPPMSTGSAHVFTLGHSPDPDDAFMFYAMAEHKIDLRGYQFEHRLEDIQTLNERAMRGELDISAISIHAYAYVRDRYALLPCGASMGDGYGPMLVAPTPMRRAARSPMSCANG